MSARCEWCGAVEVTTPEGEGPAPDCPECGTPRGLKMRDLLACRRALTLALSAIPLAWPPGKVPRAVTQDIQRVLEGAEIAEMIEAVGAAKAALPSAMFCGEYPAKVGDAVRALADVAGENP